MESWEEWEDSDPFDGEPVKKSAADAKPIGSGFLSENALKAAHPFFESQPTMKILSRRDNATSSVPPPQIAKPGGLSQAPKSFEEREREYNEARQRILYGDSPASSANSSPATARPTTDNRSSSPSASHNSPSTSASYSSSSDPSRRTEYTPVDRSEGVSRQPQGPPSNSSGFGAGRGKRV
eukprot:TRINITY_DN4926_c0_g1_i1.p1 TRINITY_DN4926_c0_g1~~TRINITY_DN4926_c0_g1_i1.p1  ORF type:complete len:190 (-),score=18.60 TRINITY_DN4926_c0_g1_i1:188-730(-)